MSALATLGNSLSSKIGIPATAATVPGDPSSVSTVGDVQSKIGLGANALGNALGNTSAPLVTLNRNPTPPVAGSAAGVVQSTTTAANTANANDPSLGNALASGQLQAATTLNATGTKNVNDGTAETASLTTQQSQNTQAIAALNPNSYSNGFLGFKGYDPSSQSAPQVIVNNIQINQAGFPTGTIYTLQADGSYQGTTLNGTAQAKQAYLEALGTNPETGAQESQPTVISTSNQYATQVVGAFSAYAKTGVALTQAAAKTALGKQQISDAATATTSAQTKIDGYANQTASNQNTAALGSQLQNIFSSGASALNNTTQVGQEAVTASQQTAGLGSLGNSGAALSAAGFRGAGTSQAQQQSYNVAQASQVDQQGAQVQSALDAQLSLAQKQSGLQLQTMSQDLTEAISALQSDLQYADQNQSIAIQAYINQLQNQQSALQNSVGQSGLDNAHITQIASGVASAVGQAGATYASTATKKASS